MDKKNKKNKSRASDKNRKDNLEVIGDLLYRNPDYDAIETDEVYYKPNVPGEYAGDC